MPELPEVETIRRHLAPHLEGRRIVDVRIDDPRWTRPLAPAEVEQAIRGRTIERLGRRGKYLIFELSGDVHLLCHLRMTGTMLLNPDAPAHARAHFDLEGTRLVYCDPRRFGTGELALGTGARDAFLGARLGKEPLDADFTAAHLAEEARGRTAPIKAFILDQRRIAGVGNIYADEALFRAKINPLQAAGTLQPPEWEALADGIVESLNAGIVAKGATIDDFRSPDGAYGSFQDQFLVHLREGQPCPDCGRAIRKLRVAGRGTYVCDSCQPLRRRRPGRAR